MKPRVLVFLLMLGFTPIVALAQVTPAPAPVAPVTPAPVAPAPPAVNPGGPMHMLPALRANMQAMRRVFQEMRRIRREARVQMLASLTSAHRALLARVVGQLAVATNPDRRAAVRQLDASLTLTEKHAILTVQHSEMLRIRAQMKALQAQARSMMAQFRAAHPDMQHQGMQHPRWIQRQQIVHRHAHRAPDAGAILLRTVTGGRGPRMVFRVRARDRR